MTLAVCSVLFCSVLCHEFRTFSVHFCSDVLFVFPSIHFISRYYIYKRAYSNSSQVPPPPFSFISFTFRSFFFLSLSSHVSVCSVRPIHYFLRVFVVRFSFEVSPITQCRHLCNNAVNILIRTSQLHTSNNNKF
jgi:hypothetical protein